MSGVELSLAVLPLIISAAENRKSILRTGKLLLLKKEKNGQQLDFFFQLSDELALLVNNLRRLISSLPTSQEVPNDFALIAGSQHWAKTISHDELSNALGANEIAFNDILERLLKSVEAIVSDKSLELSKSDVQSRDTMFAKLEAYKCEMQKNDAITLRELYQRLRFTKNERSRTVALHRIRVGNENLERLIRGSLKLVKNERRASLAKKATPRTRIRRFSGPLYDKMAGKWPKSCDCHGQHEARLCLWNCCSGHGQREPDDRLDMLVSFADADGRRTSWQQSTVRVSSEEESAREERPKVRFREVDNAMPSDPSTPNSPGRDIDPESFCNLINQTHLSGMSLQLLFERGKLWQTKSRIRSLKVQGQNDISLKDLLPLEIKLKQKRVLAVVLAHAALHCSDGPWLCRDWSKEHITFFQDDAIGLDLGRPCLAVDFQHQPSSDEEDSNLSNPHSYPALLSLGILLLEIYLCKPIESQYSPEDLIDDQPNENTNLTTAMRLLERLEDDVYEDYRTAVQACLDCDRVLASDSDRDSEEFRKQVYEDIVFPLEQELDHGFHLKPEDLRLGPQD
ncbi:MAG: hypothetical protein Q9160_002213 [Pyrenula sp. 1 TL-2023]